MSQSKQNTPVITQLTLGRNLHDITELDRFLDNGICVQLIKHNPMKVRFGSQDTMTLSKKDIGHLKLFTQVTHEQHEYLNHSSSCRVFSLTSAPVEELYVVVGRVADNDNVLKFVKSTSADDAAVQFEKYLRTEEDCTDDDIIVDYAIPLSHAENHLLAI
jgi:hypothetical protein